jgi:glycosyltransferase involved in cell wall biosynthesis
MKVGIITPGFSADEADWCIPVLVDVVRELAAQVDVHVFALRYPYRRGRYRVHGAEVHALGGGQTRDLGRAALLARACGALIAESRRGRFDALHALWADEPGALASVARRFLRTPVLVSVMGGELVGISDIGYGGQLTWSGRTLSALALRAGDWVTAGCDQSSELAEQARNPADRAKMVRLPWGVDPDIFDPAARPVDLVGTLRLLHVGSLVSVKDQLTLLRALARLRHSDPGAHLHIAGDGPLRPALCRQVSELGLAGAVTFHGHVPRDQLPGFYRAADLLVLSSRFESQSVALVEAALCNLPTIGTDVGLIADYAPEAAIAVPVGDDAGLAAAIESVRDPRARRRLAEAARRRASSEGLAAQTAGRLLDLYRRLGKVETWASATV